MTGTPTSAYTLGTTQHLHQSPVQWDLKGTSLLLRALYSPSVAATAVYLSLVMMRSTEHSSPNTAFNNKMRNTNALEVLGS